MSCGMTPEIFAKIAEMQELEKAKKNGKSKESERSLQKRVNKLEASKAESKANKQKSIDEDADEAASNWDWTRTYSSWEQFEDPEEIAAEQNKLEKKEENQARKAHMGCDHDHSAERELMDKTVRTKLDECAGFNAEGNAWFQEGQHFRAGERFRKILVWLDYTFPDEDDEQAEMDNLQLTAYTNLAVCKLKMNDIDEVIDCTYQALKLDQNNVKALYCRGKALRTRHDFDGAKTILLRALAVDPNNVQVRKEMAYLSHQKSQYHVVMKERAKAMFGFKSNKPKKATSVDYLRPFTDSKRASPEIDSDDDDDTPVIELLDADDETTTERHIDAPPTETQTQEVDGGGVVFDGGVPIEELIDFDVPLDSFE